MNNWTCCKCGCDYNWTDPQVIGGSTYCPMCADDPKVVQEATKPLHPAFWFMFGVLFGMILIQAFK